MIKEAGGLVVFRRLSKEIEFLLVKANYGDHHWSFPKGHTDPNETNLDAAIRETFEETGLDKSSLNVVQDFHRRVEYPVRSWKKVKFCVYLIDYY